MYLVPFVYSLLRDVGEISERKHRVVVPFNIAVAHGGFSQQLQARRLDNSIAALAVLRRVNHLSHKNHFLVGHTCFPMDLRQLNCFFQSLLTTGVSFPPVMF